MGELIESSSDCSRADVTIVKGGGHSQRRMDGLTDSHLVCVCRTCVQSVPLSCSCCEWTLRCSSHSGAAIPVDGILFPWIQFPLFLRQCQAPVALEIHADKIFPVQADVSIRCVLSYVSHAADKVQWVSLENCVFTLSSEYSFHTY